MPIKKLTYFGMTSLDSKNHVKIIFLLILFKNTEDTCSSTVFKILLFLYISPSGARLHRTSYK